jgi:hypothetical protein
MNYGYNNNETKVEETQVASVEVKKVKTKLDKLKDQLVSLKDKRASVEAKRKAEDKIYFDKVEKLQIEIQTEEDKELLAAVKRAKKEGKDLSILGL